MQQVDTMMQQMAAPTQQQASAPPVMQVFSTGAGGGMPPMNFQAYGLPSSSLSFAPLVLFAESFASFVLTRSLYPANRFMQSMLSGLNGGPMVGNPGDYAFGSLDNIITRLMETAG
jgi:hypothetical protein